MRELVDRSAEWLRGPQGRRAMIIVTVSLLVTAVSTVGQVNAANRKKQQHNVAANKLHLPGGSGDSTDDQSGTSTTQPGGVSGGTGPGGKAAVTSGVGHNSSPSASKYGLRTQGVTDKQVKVGLTYNVSGCGDSGALSAALGEAVTGDPNKSFDAMVRHINDTGGINGRQFVLDIADDGSGGCPEKAAAAAVKLVDQDKVFMVVPGIHDVSDYSISKKIPTLQGREDDESLKRFGANGLGLYYIGNALKVWASFAAHYIDSAHHVPCLIHPDDDEWNGNEKTLDREMAKYGLKFKTYIRYQDDVSTAQQQSQAAVTKMRDAGCDQVFFMAFNPIALIFMTSAATQGLFFPEVWTFTSYTALIDTALAANLMDKRQWKNAIGLSYRVPPGQHPAEGNCKKIYDHYYPSDDTGGDSASTQVACALLLPAAEMMRRGEKVTGRLDADAVIAGADAINRDYYFDATVPLDWSLPVGGPYKTKAMDDWTVIKWNADRDEYDFPEFPLYWKVMGPNKSGGVDLRPYFKPAS